MLLSPAQLKAELGNVVDTDIAKAAVDSYVAMQQRFLAGDWQPTELDSGRLCEAIARGCYQLDTGIVTHSQLPAELCGKIEDTNPQKKHALSLQDRYHICRAIRLLYKFRSDRGSVHISPFYTADYMDSMFMVHAAKWIFAEFLRLAWNKDKAIIADTIAQIVQLEYSLIHEMDGFPLVLDHKITAPDEILLLLNHAQGHRLSKDELLKQAKNSSENALAVALSRLLKTNEIRAVGNDEIALTPKGQKRVIEKIIPALAKRLHS
jgi:hypothetical protein